MQFSIENIKETKEVWIELVLTNNLSVLNWVNRYISEWYSEDILDLAAEYGRKEIVKFLVENGKMGTTHAIDYAAKNGHLDIIIYLNEHGFKCTEYAMTYAAYNNHFFIVQWLYENTPEGHIGIANYWAYKHENYWFEDYIKNTLSYKQKKEKELYKLSNVFKDIKL